MKDKKKDKRNINRDAPAGWFLAGTHPFEYEATLDKKSFHSGSQSCKVKCIAKKASGWTTLMQNMGPGEYLGKRLRMKYWARCKNAGYIAGWMRVDGSGYSEILDFDNMCDRKTEGTKDWTEYSIVLDIPEDSTNIGFGIIFSGTGVMWADDFTFEVVSKKTKKTTCACHAIEVHTAKAKNLDFESVGKSKSTKK